ncbi:uncharacterized protein LOC119365390 [Triticum dicoccoides]|uniref:uncharacterized protein LOC119365390 n=1 Tax=Triticum dicoccoides TaxID=85692 RepID=UPI00188FAD7C|nr:uncharacterized protein LOC119365390 [Triticum dicoccoides]
MDEDNHHGPHMVELAVVCSGAVLGQRSPPPRLLAQATASHVKGGDSQVTPRPIHGRRPQRHMGVSSSHSRVQTLPLTWCSIGGAWSAVPLPPPQRSVRWPMPLSTRVLITQYKVTILNWSGNGAEPIKRLLVYSFRDFKTTRRLQEKAGCERRWTILSNLN